MSRAFKLRRHLEGKQRIVFDPNNDCVIEFQCTVHSSSVVVYIFSCGIGVIERRNRKVIFDNVKDFDPIALAEKKSLLHKNILIESNDFSNGIRELIETIRRPFVDHCIRPSSKKEWENRGLSYVFTYFEFFVDSPQQQADLDDKVLTLCFPSKIFSSQDDILLDHSAAKFKYNSELKVDSFRQRLSPSQCIYSSWSTVCSVSVDGSKQHFNLQAFELEYQKTWMHSYCASALIQGSVESALLSNPKTISVAEQNHVAEIALQLANVEVQYAAAESGSVYLAKKLIYDTGMLKNNIQLFFLKKQIYNEFIDRVADRNRNSLGAIIASILFVLSGTQAISAYVTIGNSGHSFSITEQVTIGVVFLAGLVAFAFRNKL